MRLVSFSGPILLAVGIWAVIIGDWLVVFAATCFLISQVLSYRHNRKRLS